MYSATRKPRTHPEVWRREDAQSIPGSRDCRSSRTCSSCLSPGLTSALLWSTSGTTETPGCLHLQLWVQLKMQIRPPRLRTNPLPVSVFHYSYHSRGRNFVFSEKYFSFNYHLYFQLCQEYSRIIIVTVLVFHSLNYDIFSTMPSVSRYDLSHFIARVLK